MGQRMDHEREPRVEFDENGNNGLVLSEIYIPEELISRILCYVDYKSLLKCQMVCKRWKIIVQDYVWRKKAEMSVGESLQCAYRLPWTIHYKFCNKRPFGKNLLKNNSGQKGLTHWKIASQGESDWKVEKPPTRVPELPHFLFINQIQSCFVTCSYNCLKRQTVDLSAEGFSPEFLDECQPSITIGEWFICGCDDPEAYECLVLLLGERSKFLDSYHFPDQLHGDSQIQWHFISHTFKDYGPGLRKVRFEHGGKPGGFRIFGCKMTAASVVVNVPKESELSKIQLTPQTLGNIRHRKKILLEKSL